MMAHIALSISQLDTLFFRDARPFGPAAHAQSGLPTPQTLTGAIRTLLLEYFGINWDAVSSGMRQHGSFRRCLEGLGQAIEGVADVRICGPWFFHEDDVLVPTPLSLRQTKGDGNPQIRRLDPLETPPPGWRPPFPGMHPLWRRARGALEATPPYIRPRGLQAFLEGQIPEASDFVKAEDLYSFDQRTGIGRSSARGTIEKGLIYSVSLLSLRRDVSFYAEVMGPASTLSPLEDRRLVMRFGGEGRHVNVHTMPNPFSWPAASAVRADGKVILLTSPVYLCGCMPQGIDTIAAAVGRPNAISGWDMARGGPKPNRFMVPAGSVFFLSPGVPVPKQLGTPEDFQIGWGQFIDGNWYYV